jgi:hypothetical protein
MSADLCSMAFAESLLSCEQAPKPCHHQPPLQLPGRDMALILALSTLSDNALFCPDIARTFLMSDLSVPGKSADDVTGPR